jgi:hypothetical protein
LNNAKILVSEAEIMKIPSQKGKLIKVIEDPPHKTIERPPMVAY